MFQLNSPLGQSESESSFVSAYSVNLSPAGGILVTVNWSGVRICESLLGDEPRLGDLFVSVLGKYKSLPEPIKAVTVLDLDQGDAAST